MLKRKYEIIKHKPLWKKKKWEADSLLIKLRYYFENMEVNRRYDNWSATSKYTDLFVDTERKLKKYGREIRRF